MKKEEMIRKKKRYNKELIEKEIPVQRREINN